MKQTEISSFDELVKELQAKSKEVTIPKRDCHTGKKVIGFRVVRNHTLKLKEGPHNSRPLSELLK